MRLGLILSLILGVSLTGCTGEPDKHYYMVAKRVELMPPLTITINMIRRFEKNSWCQAELESMVKREFETTCSYEAEEYKPFFEGQSTGQWYIVRSMGRFNPTVIIYEIQPKLPDEIMLKQLQHSAPHTLKFAALHKAPAEVRIYGPDGKQYGLDEVFIREEPEEEKEKEPFVYQG